MTGDNSNDRGFKMVDDTPPTSTRKNDDGRNKNKKKIRFGRARKIGDLKMPVREDKIIEIREVWQSPKLKTHNQRLIYLLRHCTIIEPQYGYTIREFAHAIHPEKMNPESTGEYDSEHYAFRAIRQMFNRFNHDVTNHEVMLSAVLAKGTGKWYYYNIIDDEQAIKDRDLRMSRIALGYHRLKQELQHIVEHSEEIEREHKARYDEIMKELNSSRKQKKDKLESELKRNPLKVKRKRDENQKTLD